MCLFDDVQDGQSRVKMRRRLAGLAIMLIALSFMPELLHLRAGGDADAFDFLRGLMVGIALVFSITAFTMCRRRTVNNG